MGSRSLTISAAVVCTALLSSGEPVSAHHSFAAEFDASAPVRLAGTVARVEWTNPHVWIFVEVDSGQSDAVTWAIEGSTPNALARHGITKDMVRPGARVVVRGYRAKNRTPTARGSDITLADGRTLSLGSPDR